MKEKILVANWKCNPDSSSEASRLARASDARGVIIAPPFIFLGIGEFLKNASLSAQDVFWSSGAYTGEISPVQLSRLGIKYAIIGHSERRELFGETDEMVSMKAKAALDAGLSVIICVGESASDRAEGNIAAERAVRRSVIGSLSGIPPKRSNKVIVAYEPIWAIGTGEADSPINANNRSRLIKSVAEGMGLFGISVLYGGSVLTDNALGFLGQSEIDGLLVGGASLDEKEFAKIITVFSRVNGTGAETKSREQNARSEKSSLASQKRRGARKETALKKINAKKEPRGIKRQQSLRKKAAVNRSARVSKKIASKLITRRKVKALKNLAKKSIISPSSPYGTKKAAKKNGVKTISAIRKRGRIRKNK